MIPRNDLKILISSELTGICVNPSSISISFSETDGGSCGWILITCPFECVVNKANKSGHGADPDSAQHLIKFIKAKVTNVIYEENKKLVVHFSNETSIILIPEKNGFESYVLHTKEGILPVIDY